MAVLVVLVLSGVAGVPTAVGADPSVDPTRFTGSNFWQTPDDPSLDITGPIDIRVAVRMDDWTPPSNGNGTRVAFVSKWGNADGAWGLSLITSDDPSFPNHLLMFWDDEVGGNSSRSVVGPTVGAADGTLLGIRATLEPAILRVRFFSKPTTEATALADMGSDTGWSQLGSDITGAASPPINSTSDPVTIGTLRPQDASLRLYDANIYAVVVKNGIDGTTVLNPDLGSEADGETNFTDDSGRSWTEKGHVAHRWRANGNANDSIGTNHGTLVGGATASGSPAAEGSNAFSLDGIDDRVEMPDVSSHYFSGSFTIQTWVRSTVVGPLQWVVTKFECGGASPATCTNSFYRLGLDGNGAPFADLRDSDAGGPDGGSNSQGVSAGNASIADGTFHHLRFVRDVDADLLAIYVDGALAGLEELHPGVAGPLGNDDGGADPLVVGAIYGALSNSLNSFFSGQIDDVQLSGEGVVSSSDFAPTLTDVDPDSPADDNNPEIKGTAVPGSTVKLYTNSNCTGSPVATGTAANFASPGLTATVPDNSTTTFYATATPQTGTGSTGTTTSECSTSSITYTEESSDLLDAVTLIKAKPLSGGLAEAQIDDGQNMSLKSKKKGTKRVVVWTGRFDDIPASATSFTLHYEGATSRPVKRKALFFNPSTGKFECPTGDPADCVIAKGVSTIDIAGGNLAQYRDGNGDVLIKVQGKARRSYTETTDVLGITYES